MLQVIDKPRKRLHPGDVAEIRTKHGVALFHYVGYNPSIGHAIYVYPVWYKSRGDALQASLPKGYMTYYPAQSATLQRLARIVATAPLRKGISLSTRWRRCGYTTPRGEVLAWIIIEPDGREKLKRRLTAKDRQLPIESVWSHYYLIDRITEGWRPEQEV